MYSINNIIAAFKNKEIGSYNSCFYSSFVFLLNVSVALYYGYYVYAGLFVALFITSLLHHTHYTFLTTVIDKIVIFSIVFYGVYIFYKKIVEYLNSEESLNIKQYILSFLIIFTFLSTIVLYYYGYFFKCFCYCEDAFEADLFHYFMHCFVFCSHCCIVLL
jgi:hypothetical protein